MRKRKYYFILVAMLISMVANAQQIEFIPSVGASYVNVKECYNKYDVYGVSAQALIGCNFEATENTLASLQLGMGYTRARDGGGSCNFPSMFNTNIWTLPVYVGMQTPGTFGMKLGIEYHKAYNAGGNWDHDWESFVTMPLVFDFYVSDNLSITPSVAIGLKNAGVCAECKVSWHIPVVY